MLGSLSFVGTLTSVLRLGVIGFGQWGPNHVRNFRSVDGCDVVWVCDQRDSRLALAQSMFRDLQVTSDADRVIGDASVDAVVIATPAKTHFGLAKAALLAGKDVLCEKPLASTVAECEELTALAAREKRILMVGHVFLYHACVQHLKADLNAQQFGRIYSLDAVRTNLGPFRQDVGAIHDLASHDIAIFNYLLGSMPTAVSATGGFFLQKEHEDIGFLTLSYPSGVVCHVHTSWLNPRKVRQMTIVGDAKMAVWDDMHNLEPIRYYDKGVSVDHYSSFGEFQMVLRDGTITIPKVSMVEPLLVQDREFAACVRARRTPESDGAFGTQVMRVLEAASASLREGGKQTAVTAA